MKEKTQNYPRLYLDICKSEKDRYSVKHYDNQYNDDGSLKIQWSLISSDFFSDEKSDESKLYKLNKIEYQTLINLINKQKKVIQVYSNKNKLEQLNIVNSSLELMLEYERMFLKWFSENKDF